MLTKRIYKHKNTKKAFTLIELLVVIAIVGFLASIVLASINTVRMKARNTERITTLHEIRNALELYYNDHGEYPEGTAYSPWNNVTGYSDWRNPDPSRPKPMKELMDNGYISDIGDDPINSETSGGGPAYSYLGHGPPQDLGYVYCSNNNHGNCPNFDSRKVYVLGTNLEEGGPSPNRWGNYQFTNP